ncbi:MAG TPA: FkbM family methyltransferase [Longimicrobium sp.]|nr:FkbM family methyltransferase [Longimicrobium sp.]
MPPGRIELLKYRLRHFVEDRLGVRRHRRVRARVLGRTYEVVAGSVRAGSDYGDAWLAALAREARVVFDVGANVGQAALAVLAWDTVEEIVLVEANPDALAVAAENLVLNGLAERARFVRAFAADADGAEVRFYTVGTGSAGSLYPSFADIPAALGLSSMVPTVTLDALARRYGLVPDLVKVDVEAAEALVLAGAREIASHGRTRFFVEMHSTVEVLQPQNAAKVLAWCADVGYRAWYLAGRAELTDAAHLGRARCHLLLLPRAAAVPELLGQIEERAPLERVMELIGGDRPG